MKKIVSLSLALVFVLLLFVACGQPANPAAAASVNDIQTLGDAFSLPSAEYITAYSSGNKYAYGFSVDGVYYRAVATMSDELADQYYAVDYSQENAGETAKNMIAPLKVDAVENLTEQIPPQEELDKWVGKTGEDLMNDDWWGVFYNFEEWEVEMNHGLFSFTVKFEEGGELPEDYDADEVIRPLTVQSVTFCSLGDLTHDFDMIDG